MKIEILRSATLRGGMNIILIENNVQIYFLSEIFIC